LQKNRFVRKYVILSIAIIFLTGVGCQDHHFVPFAEMGLFSIIEGTIYIESGTANDYETWSLYVFVRSEGAKTFLAAIKRKGVSFPYHYTIRESDVIMGEVAKNKQYVVDSVLDVDGDINTRGPKDLMGRAKGSFSIGATNVNLTLRKHFE
jgi:hypothetical protein